MWADGVQLGISNTIYAYNHPHHMLLMLPGLIGISGDFVSKSLVVIVLLVSTCSAYYLSKYIFSTYFTKPQESTSNKFLTQYLPAFFTGCIYGYGPLGFNMLLSGGLTFLLSYAIAPLVLLLLLKAINNMTLKGILLASIGLAFIAGSMQIAILMNITLLILAITAPNKRNGLIALLAILFFQTLLMMYWIMPVVSDLDQLFVHPLATEEISLEKSIEFLETRTDPLPRVLTTEWFLKRDGTSFLSTEDINSILHPFWTIAIYLVVIVVFSTSLLYPKKVIILVSNLICLILVGFSAGAKSPIRDFVLMVYEYTPRPLIGMFRYPSYWIKLVPLYYAVLFGCAAISISRIGSKSRIVLSIVLGISVLMWTAPFWDGNLGNKIDVFNFPPELHQIDRYMLAEKENDRAFYLPPETGVRFEDTEYQTGGLVGIDMVLAYPPRPAFDIRRVWNKNSYDVIWRLQNSLLTSPPPSGISVILGIANIKYLVLRQDVHPSSASLGSKWDWESVNKVLKENDGEGIEIVEDFPNMSLWQNNNWWPRIYVTSDLIKVPKNSSIDCLTEISAFFNQQEYLAIVEDDIATGAYKYQFDEMNHDNQCIDTPKNTSHQYLAPNFRFRQVNPTKYKIQIEQSKDPYLLVFSDTYHPQWTMNIEPSTISSVISDRSRGYKEVQHILVNGYANGWWIEKPGTYEITIEFLPQQWYEIGVIISTVILMLSMIYVMLIHFRHRLERLQ
jgi:hypothetical protein